MMPSTPIRARMRGRERARTRDQLCRVAATRDWRARDASRRRGGELPTARVWRLLAGRDHCPISRASAAHCLSGGVSCASSFPSVPRPGRTHQGITARAPPPTSAGGAPFRVFACAPQNVGGDEECKKENGEQSKVKKVATFRGGPKWGRVGATSARTLLPLFRRAAAAPAEAGR